MGIFEKHLSSHPDWQYFAGNELTIADFKMLAQIYATARNDTQKHPAINEALKAQIANYPHVHKYIDKVAAHFTEYLAARPKCTI